MSSKDSDSCPDPDMVTIDPGVSIECNICHKGISMKTEDTYIVCFMKDGMFTRVRECETCHIHNPYSEWPVGCTNCGKTIEKRSDAIIGIVDTKKNIHRPQARMMYICCSIDCEHSWLRVASEFFTGQVAKFLTYVCTSCKTKSCTLKICSRCKCARYCSVACQKRDWPRHKEGCRKAAENLKSS